MMDQRVQHVVSFIRDNYQRKLTLKEMADTVNLSPWWLCHLFKNDMGTSPERFLSHVRLERAKCLLENSFLSIKEVMSEVGISDAGHFSRSFKAAYGVTPAKWRGRPASHEHQEEELEKEIEKEKEEENRSGDLPRSQGVPDADSILAVGQRGDGG